MAKPTYIVLDKQNSNVCQSDKNSKFQMFAKKVCSFGRAFRPLYKESVNTDVDDDVDKAESRVTKPEAIRLLVTGSIFAM